MAGISVVLVSLLSLLAAIFFSWRSFQSNDVVADQISSFEIVNEFPHDPAAFTQGLLYGGKDTLFESTGLYGHLKFFTHGMDDGWGLATDGKILFGSDGSSTLYHLNPQTMKVMEEHVVKYNGHEVHNLNELEYINNEVWANIWQSDCIARISPVDGTVIGWIVLPELREELLSAGYKIDVLNGIAWDEDKKRLFVTGKLWPKLYEIKLQPLRKRLQAPVERLCLRERTHLKE